jgi:hypothetical protein
LAHVAVRLVPANVTDGCFGDRPRLGIDLIASKNPPPRDEAFCAAAPDDAFGEDQKAARDAASEHYRPTSIHDFERITTVFLLRCAGRLIK